MEAKRQSNFNVLMFPWLAHGHLFPFLELAKKLSHKNFNIYFCSTPINLDSVKNELKKTSHSSIQLLELHLPPSPDLPPQFHTTRNAPPNLKEKLFQAFQMSKSCFSDIITNLKPDLLIYDVHQPWSPKIALSLGIPAVHFSIVGPAPLSFFHHHTSTYKDSPFPYQALYLRDFEKKSIVVDLSHVINDKSNQDFGSGHFKQSHEIVLIKGCRGIEAKYIDYLSLCCQKKVLPVGSLVTVSHKSEEDNDTEIMEWLIKKNQFSTLFISFGSESYLSKDQIQEIAKGLELCDVNFIWVVKSPLGETVIIEEVMPEGFLDRVKERGLILQGWAPQAKILAHKSVGAFMSHCGMSSTIESLYFGIPVVAMPLKVDSPLNARFLVEAGIGIEIVRDENGKYRGEEVAIAINKVFLEQSLEGMRVKAAELSQIMKNEEKDAMDEAAQQLWQICVKHEQQQQQKT